MKNQIILVHPKSKSETRIRYPLSCLAIAATLEKENFKPIILDMEIDKDYRSIVKKYLSEVLFIGISTMTDWQIKYALELCDFVRESDPNVPIVWGGWHPTTLPEQTVRDKRVDIVVKGEGDFVVVELAKTLQRQNSLSGVKGIMYKIGDKIVNNPESDPFNDLNILPPTPWHLIDINKYIKHFNEKTLCINSGRGCAMSCSFCSHKVVPNKKPRILSAENICNNVEQAIRDFNITNINFYEPTFIASKKRAIEISDEIIRRNLKITWEGSCRTNVLAKFDDNICAKLKQSGCKQLNFGIESGSQRVLKLIGKHTNLKNILETIKKCKAHDIIAECYFISGFPFETARDVLKTTNLIFGINNIDPKSKICGGILSPLPGTNLYNECVKNYGLPVVSSLEDWGNPIEWNKHPWLHKRRRFLLFLMDRLSRKSDFDIKKYMQSLDSSGSGFKYARLLRLLLFLRTMDILRFVIGCIRRITC